MVAKLVLVIVLSIVLLTVIVSYIQNRDMVDALVAGFFSFWVSFIVVTLSVMLIGNNFFKETVYKEISMVDAEITLTLDRDSQGILIDADGERYAFYTFEVVSDVTAPTIKTVYIFGDTKSSKLYLPTDFFSSHTNVKIR